MSKSIGSAIVLFWVVSIAVACTQLQVEKPSTVSTKQALTTPLSIPSPTTSDSVVLTPHVSGSPSSIPAVADTKMTRTNVCYVHIIEAEEQLGGMPSQLETIYLAKDGTIQQTREKNDDTILFLSEGTVDTSDILQKLGNLELPVPDKAEPEGNGVIVSEYVGPTLQVEVAFCNAPARQWSGSFEDVPPDLEELTENVKALANSIPAQPIMSGEKCIRSQSLTVEKGDQLRRAELVVDVNDEQLESSPLIKEVITYERRLIRVLPDENPYGTIPLSFTHGRSGHIGYNQQVYQIRHLLIVEP